MVSPIRVVRNVPVVDPPCSKQTLANLLSLSALITADPEDVEMYFVFGTTPGTCLLIIRAKRGSSKNEAINKLIEVALMTTAKLSPDMACGKYIQAQMQLQPPLCWSDLVVNRDLTLACSVLTLQASALTALHGTTTVSRS